MPLVIREIHAAPSPASLNEEWVVVENTGDKSFSTAGCTLQVGRSKNARFKAMGTLDPGFTVAPGAQTRIVTGNPGRKAHGKAPDATDQVPNYHLFLGNTVLGGPGTIVSLTLRQHELVRATFDPTAPGGVAPSKNGSPA